MDADALLTLLHGVVDAVGEALGGLADWGPAGTRAGQYRSDLVADEIVVQRLVEAGFGVVSEESGAHRTDRAIVVVADPVDGSTNASRRLPWYATSLCALDDAGPLAALVANQATGTRYQAVRGGGAWRDGDPVHPTACRALGEALVGLNGHARRHLGWKQYRALGAAALDLCAVADGTLDAYVDCTRRSLAPWDYLGGMLVCREAGAVVAEADGEDLVVTDPTARRSPVAAATDALLDELLAARAGMS